MTIPQLIEAARLDVLREQEREPEPSAERLNPIRVRFYPSDTSETFDGTVIDEKPNFYVVIPDQNLALTQNWNKKRCDIIPSHSA